jgi:hypothetical protein
MRPWMWAGAVARDSENFEGLELECDRSNEKLRDVFQHFIDAGEGMSSPSGRGRTLLNFSA